MMLYDRIRELAHSQRDRWTDREACVFGFMSKAVVFDINSVLELSGDWRTEREKNVPRKPPFDNVWCEWNSMLTTHSGRSNVRVGALILRFTHSQAKLALASDCDEIGFSSITRLTEMPEVYNCLMFYHILSSTEPAHQQRLLLERGKPLLVNNHGATIIGMNADGTSFAAESITYTEETPPLFCYHSYAVYDVDELNDCDFPWPPLMAFSLLHCKNVSTIDNPPDPKLQREVTKQGNPARVTFKTLAIEVPKSCQARQTLEFDEGDDGPKVRFHLCSGHFKNLQNDRYKNKGWHWWPAHWRGSKELGEVHKRYQIKTTEAAGG